MNVQTHFRPPVIEALTTLWRALPPRGVTDERGTMDDCCFALADCSAEAIINTVNNLRAGKIEDASKSFCPKAPELAVLVRSEQARIDAVNRPKAISYQPVNRPWVDHRERQISQAFKEKRAFIEHATIDQSQARTRARKYAPYSVWFWSLGPVDTGLGSMYGPPGSAETDAQIWGANREHLPKSVVIHV